MKNSRAQLRFPRPQKDSFHKVLRSRIREYFRTGKISVKANRSMYFKTAVMLCLYFVPYSLMLTLNIGVAGTLLLFLLMGLGMAGIGMSVMHDAAHGAYHKKNWVNRLLSSSIYLISGNAATWKIQHNLLHHTFTNIEGLDEDMDTSGLLRLHPNQEWRWFHRYQQFYVPFVYGLLTLNWVMAKDFKQLIRYYKMGVGGHTPKSIRKEWMILIFTKLLYFGMFVALPLWLVPVHWAWVLLGFALMHFTAGVVLSFVFQLAHMIEGVENMSIPASGQAEDEWMEHQLKTTSNFACNNRWVSFFVGGLNYQVEHHLFPDICHIHYPAISRIVKNTAQEYGLPYYEKPRLGQALSAHVNHLGLMSRPPLQIK